MILAGLNVARINFSHCNHCDAEKIISWIKELNAELNTHVAVLGDLCGPKLRVGNVLSDNIISSENNPVLQNGTLDSDKNNIYIDYAEVSEDVKVGDKILLDDGRIILRAKAIQNKKITCSVLQGGTLSSNKGVNLPNTKISLPTITKKDLSDIFFCVQKNIEWIALSFVRTDKDIIALKNILKEHNGRCQVIAKIEKPEAIKNLKSIISQADALMVARGDLGVEVPPQKVPVLQKKIVRASRKKAKPVIIATQMMESMINSLTATRAEVNDVANSVMDGADAVMLSGETSVGEYPIQVIQAMSSIICSVENSDLISVPQKPPNIRTVRFITKSICYHAVHIANDVKAKAICTLTNSGYTAFQVSAWRPNSYILVFTSNKRILTQLNLIWGVKAFFYDSFESTDKTVEQINEIAKKSGYVENGDLMVNLTAMPIDEKGMVNTLRVSTI